MLHNLHVCLKIVNKTKKTHTHTQAWTHIVHDVPCHNRGNPWMLAYLVLELPCLIFIPNISYRMQVSLGAWWKLGAPNLELVTLHSFQSSWKNLGNSVPMPQNKMSSINKGSKASFTKASFCTSSFDCAMDWKQSIECLVGTQIQILKLTILDLRLDRI